MEWTHVTDDPIERSEYVHPMYRQSYEGYSRGRFFSILPFARGFSFPVQFRTFEGCALKNKKAGFLLKRAISLLSFIWECYLSEVHCGVSRLAWVETAAGLRRGW